MLGISHRGGDQCACVCVLVEPGAGAWPRRVRRHACVRVLVEPGAGAWPRHVRRHACVRVVVVRELGLRSSPPP